MNTAPTLSVVLPNYNHAAFLRRALTALLAQDRPADEIIIVDDGSTDESIDVIKTFATTASSIRLLVNGKNEGVIPALIRGFRAARGRYVYFAAADDWVMPGFFRLALDSLEENPALGLFCGEAALVDGRTGKPSGRRPTVPPSAQAAAIPPAGVYRMLKNADNWILTGSAIFRRDAVAWAGGLDVRLGSFADGILARKIALTFGMYFAPQVVATWSVYPDSVSRRTALELKSSNQALGALPKYLAGDPVFPKWYPRLFQDRWRFATSRLALEAQPIDSSLLLSMGARNSMDRLVLTKICSALSHDHARRVALAWLWFRLRPMTFASVMRLAAAHRRRNRQDHALAHSA